MKKLSILLVCVFALPAIAQVPFGGTLENKYISILEDGTVVETNPPIQEAQGVWYDSVDQVSGYLAFPAASGAIGFDDYSAAVPAGDTMIDLGDAVDGGGFRFVGGVGTVGGLATFDFFDAGQTFVDSFSVALPQAGNFIWTINIAPGSLIVPADGIVQMSIDGSTDPVGGQFFLHGDAPTIGSNDLMFGGATDTIHAFAISGNSLVPEPGSLSLLIMGGLAALGFVRRR